MGGEREDGREKKKKKTELYKEKRVNEKFRKRMSQGMNYEKGREGVMKSHERQKSKDEKVGEMKRKHNTAGKTQNGGKWRGWNMRIKRLT